MQIEPKPMSLTSPRTHLELSAFLENNPLVRVEQDSDRTIVKNPWGDETLILRLPEAPEEMIRILNTLILPPLFSALYHTHVRDLEFIYSPRKTEQYGRRFEFYFKDKEIICEFTDASPELRKLASIARPIAPPSHTDHRNLATFNTMRRLSQDQVPVGTSFWIRGIDWDPDIVLELTRNLNFYMWYFDSETPRIRIHEQRPVESTNRMPQFLFDTFPAKILGRPVDPFLLQLWEGFIKGNVISRTLYGYQIVEYVAFYYLQESIEQRIRHILMSPAILARPAEASRQILEAVTEDRMDDAAKIEKVFETQVDHERLSSAIRCNLPYFSADLQFDGGFNLPAICSNKWEPKDAKECKDLSRRVANSLRKLRNAIAHSRESRNSNSIAPTLANQDRLFPWLYPLSIIVTSLMIYDKNNH